MQVAGISRASYGFEIIDDITESNVAATGGVMPRIRKVLALVAPQIAAGLSQMSNTSSGLKCTCFKQESSFDWPTLESHSGRSLKDMPIIDIVVRNLVAASLSIGGGVNPFHFHLPYLEYEGPIGKTDQLHMIGERLAELEAQRKEWLSYINDVQVQDPVVRELHEQVKKALAGKHTIKPTSDGCGGAYILEGNSGKKFIVKVVAEEIHGVLNAKGFGLPVEAHVAPVREGIPLYRSHQIAAFVAYLARTLGFKDITPPVAIEIVKGPFYNLFDNLDPEVRNHPKVKQLMKEHPSGGQALVYVEPFIENACDLWDWVHNLTTGSNEDVSQENIEQLMLLMWLTYEADGNLGNFLVQEVDGKPRVIKVDNDLSMPISNLEYRQYLSRVFKQEMNHPLSEAAKMCVLKLDEPKLERMAEQLGLDDCIDAFKERLNILRILMEESHFQDATLGEIDGRMTLLSYIGGELGVEAAKLPEVNVNELYKVLRTYRFVGPPAMIYQLYREGKLTEVN